MLSSPSPPPNLSESPCWRMGVEVCEFSFLFTWLVLVMFLCVCVCVFALPFFSLSFWVRTVDDWRFLCYLIVYMISSFVCYIWCFTHRFFYPIVCVGMSSLSLILFPFRWEGFFMLEGLAFLFINCFPFFFLPGMLFFSGEVMRERSLLLTSKFVCEGGSCCGGRWWMRLHACPVLSLKHVPFPKQNGLSVFFFAF